MCVYGCREKKELVHKFRFKSYTRIHVNTCTPILYISETNELSTIFEHVHDRHKATVYTKTLLTLFYALVPFSVNLLFFGKNDAYKRPIVKRLLYSIREVHRT